MRSIQEIEQQFTFVCAQIGNLELKKTQVLAQLDAQLAPLHEQAAQLQAEGTQVKAVADEVAKATAAAASSNGESQ